jgi:nicotinate phosphoribosyltransferase
LNEDGSFYEGEVVTLSDETTVDMMYHSTDPKKSRNLSGFQKEPLLEKVMEDGERLTEPRSVQEIAEFSRNQLSRLPVEFQRFENPHIYKIGLSEKLKDQRNTLVKHHKEKV